MIKPIDIQEKEFTKAVRGYKEDEVNEFLDEITIDLERILDELRQTKEETAGLLKNWSATGARKELFLKHLRQPNR